MKKIFENKRNLVIGLISIVLLLLIAFAFQFKDYIPHDNEFSRTGNMTIPREGHKAVLLKDGRVLILGGATCKNEMWVGRIQKMCGGTTNTAEVYSPKTGKFKRVGNMHVQNSEFTATLLNDGKVLIVGSYESRKPNNSELFNPDTNKFENTAPLNIQRSRYFTATLLKDGRVLIVGGMKEKLNSLKSEILKEAEIYNPQTGKFTPTGTLNTPRFGHGAILLNDGKVLILGGATKGKYLSSAELYNPKTGKFSPISNMHYARKMPNAILLKDGKVLIAGGYDYNGYEYMTEMYNPNNNIFLDMAIQEKTGRAATITLMPNGNVLFIGGGSAQNNKPQIFNQAEIFAPSIKKFIKTLYTNAPRIYNTATLMNNNTVLVTGGKKMLGIENKAEIFNYKY